METLSYTEFSRRISVSTSGRRVPTQGTIELTNRCPLNCSHCYNNLPMNDVAARRAELSTQEYFHLLDELADLGTLWLCFSGGEALARRDFFDIYAYAKRKGFLITIFTNGILIDERVADRFAAMPPFSIEITLYGRTKETYEALTRIPGSWEKCMRGIDLLSARGIEVKLKTVAVTVNVHEVFDMKAFADERGLEFKFDSMMNPRIDCSSAPLGVRLSPREIVELDLRDETRISEWQRLGVMATAPVTPEGGREMYDCGGGVHSWALDPYGNLTICVLSHQDNFNVREYSFAEAWDLLNGVRKKPATRPTKCTRCAMSNMCGMCPANGELENGDPEAPVDFLCHLAHLRAATFDIDFPAHGECEYCRGGAAHATILEEAEQARSATAFAPMIQLSTTNSSAEGCGSGGCSSCSTMR
jgi:radical SAM protein with 4Fe4S-binding SPASM domain